MISQLVRNLRDQLRLPGIAEMFSKIVVPSIAEWRWGTLHEALKALHGNLATLREHFKVCLFLNAHNPVKVRKCNAAFQSNEWHWQFEFTRWLCSWLCRIQQWGKGCRCHRDEKASKGCKWKGRRLPEAQLYIAKKLAWGLQEASQWTRHTFCTTQEQVIDL